MLVNGKPNWWLKGIQFLVNTRLRNTWNIWQFFHYPTEMSSIVSFFLLLHWWKHYKMTLQNICLCKINSTATARVHAYQSGLFGHVQNNNSPWSHSTYLCGYKNYEENYNVYVHDSMPMLFRVFRFLCKYCYLSGGFSQFTEYVYLMKFPPVLLRYCAGIY